MNLNKALGGACFILVNYQFRNRKPFYTKLNLLAIRQMVCCTRDVGVHCMIKRPFVYLCQTLAKISYYFKATIISEGRIDTVIFYNFTAI